MYIFLKSSNTKIVNLLSALIKISFYSNVVLFQKCFFKTTDKNIFVIHTNFLRISNFYFYAQRE